MDEEVPPTHQTFDLNAEDVEAFAARCGLTRAAPDRVSLQLTVELYLHSEVPGAADIAPKVIDQIEVLEGRRPQQGMKDAEQFKHPPLRGLWKSHYLRHAHEAVPMNILQEFRNPNNAANNFLRAQFKKMQEHETEITAVVLNEYAVKIGNLFTDRRERGALTGEWIVFAKHNGQNYYLTLGRHKEGDQYIHQRIVAGCMKQFPFIASIISMDLT